MTGADTVQADSQDMGQEQLQQLHAQQQLQQALPQLQHPQSQQEEACLAEDDGWLMALCYDAASRSSELVVLDALKLQQGPIAILPLRKTIPHGLHGNWSDHYFGPKL